jgi:MYXO-CTERM domain-containing protein
MSMRGRLLLAFALSGAIALLAPSPARAKTRYPQYIWDYFCLSPSARPDRGGCVGGHGSVPSPAICTNPSTTPDQGWPPCRLCHIQGTTGSGTLQTPFAVSMLARGLTGEDTSVCAALAAMGNVDSDGDGKSDLSELENDTDPNTRANVQLSVEPTPSYGCSVASSSPRAGWPALALAVGALLLPLGRRRRR